MKTISLSKITGVLIATIFSVSYALAQTTTPPTQVSVVAPHNVSVSSTHIYDVAYTVRGAVANQYTWTIFTADAAYTKGAAAVSGTDYSISAGATAAIQNIHWLKAGHYVIELQELNPAANGSCAGALQTLNINVGPTGTVEFLNATGTDLCPVAGGYAVDPKYTGTISYPITVDVLYTINGTTSTATISVASAAVKIDIPAIVGFTNNTTTTDDATRSVKITGAKDSFGGVLALGTTDTHTFTVWSKPATTPIHHD